MPNRSSGQSGRTSGLAARAVLVSLGAMLWSCAAAPLPRLRDDDRVASAASSAPTSSSIRVTYEADTRLNPDSAGRSLPTTVRTYQLRRLDRLQHARFDEVWQRAEATLGDDLLQAEELVLFPGRRVSRSITRVPHAAYVVGVAIVRHPVGDSWRAVYELPTRSEDRDDSRPSLRDRSAEGPRSADAGYYFRLEDNRIETGEDPGDPASN
jgi:type VI secretion system VasD/TssJ family lipoprotein